jgi:glucosylglycerate synthase
MVFPRTGETKAFRPERRSEIRLPWNRFAVSDLSRESEMATADPIPGLTTSSDRTGGSLLVQLAPMAEGELEPLLAKLAASFSAGSLLVATAEPIAPDSFPGLQILSIPAGKASVMLTSADFVNAYQLAEEHDARAVLMLGPEAGSLGHAALQNLANAVLSTPADLAIPYYRLPPNAGLVNSAILYPLTRALFASQARYPLAIDLGLSLRMADRLARSAQRFTMLDPGEALLWPVNEAAVAGFSMNEIDVGPRALPQPIDPDINSVLAQVTGSLFADIDLKAAFWQRARRLALTRNPVRRNAPADGAADTASMIETFRLGHSNLQEIWSLVLPPNSLLGLKRLSVADAASFRMPETLWARIVYDFLLAFRLRSINRGHLLGALIPLYLAWVAGHLNIAASGEDPESHVEAVASAFETEKPYLVSRWRWPDRFNP